MDGEPKPIRLWVAIRSAPGLRDGDKVWECDDEKFYKAEDRWSKATGYQVILGKEISFNEYRMALRSVVGKV